MLPKPNSYQAYQAPKALVNQFIALYNEGRLEEVFLLGEEIIQKHPKTPLIILFEAQVSLPLEIYLAHVFIFPKLSN